MSLLSCGIVLLIQCHRLHELQVLAAEPREVGAAYGRLVFVENGIEQRVSDQSVHAFHHQQGVLAEGVEGSLFQLVQPFACVGARRVGKACQRLGQMMSRQPVGQAGVVGGSAVGVCHHVAVVGTDGGLGGGEAFRLLAQELYCLSSCRRVRLRIFFTV